MSTSKVIELLAAMACMFSILTEIQLNQLKHHGSTIATCSKLAMWNNPIFDNIITNIYTSKNNPAWWDQRTLTQTKQKIIVTYHNHGFFFGCIYMTKFAFFPAYFAFLLCSINLPILLFPLPILLFLSPILFSKNFFLYTVIKVQVQIII